MFDAINDPDELIVLEFFEEETIGFVFASKNLIKNCIKIFEKCNEEGIVLAADGTYKLTNNGWPLLLLGAEIQMVSNDERLSCLPLLCAWVKTEPQLAYIKLFGWFEKVLVTYGEIEGPVNVVAGKCDHSDAIWYLYSYLILIFSEFYN